MPPKLFVATKAFVVHQGKVLILRESRKYADGTNADRFDVPGGRVQPGQNFKDSLLREVSEETGLPVEVGQPFYVGEWRPIVREEQWQIVGIYFECLASSPEVRLSSDHNQYLWIPPEKFKAYNLIPNVQAAFQAYLDPN